MSISNNCALYHQTKTSINFNYMRKLNLKSQIQLLKTLQIYRVEFFCFRVELNALIHAHVCRKISKSKT